MRVTKFVSESVCTIGQVLFTTCITGVCKYDVHECVCVCMCVCVCVCVCVVVYKKICHTIVYRAMYATMQVCAQVGASMSSCTMCELKVLRDRNRSRVGVADIRR